ncbi:MBL fold metallo-hydrolase [Deinococcus maricopensis]|uniref:Beta-lactamase domain protein n=1 Tax=Deinococcus maricopensis (strain DSM 21211 / LMG 22137 / NRRL B-23946 / LB-34) TaxID=709986 RepID=E8U8V6_DEIML|nr:MBL fold metallo-hydrolase [Deinococcus maricopensis]ADV67495.1 beta-lactamase domain protein [Deinococcus maricopensis DSM 21211]
MTWLHTLTLGDARVTSLTDGQFRLDGGAMFGVVPKALWANLTAPDEDNRIPLRINPLLIQLGGQNVLVETGMWDRGGEKFDAMYAVERDETLFTGLRAVGLTPNDIHLVINTHLHFDHCGRNTDALGQPTFPNARYVVQRQELEDALSPHDRNRASYIPDTFMPIHEAGLFEVVDGETELLPGLSVVPLPGHNLGQQGVVLQSGGRMLVACADLMPTLVHAPYAYNMGYDLYPVTNLEVRKRYFPAWAEAGAIIAPPHDPHAPFGRFESAKRGYTAVPVFGEQ